jgi:hypothetical protein
MDHAVNCLGIMLHYYYTVYIHSIETTQCKGCLTTVKIEFSESSTGIYKISVKGISCVTYHTKRDLWRRISFSSTDIWSTSMQHHSKTFIGLLHLGNNCAALYKGSRLKNETRISKICLSKIYLYRLYSRNWDLWFLQLLISPLRFSC